MITPVPQSRVSLTTCAVRGTVYKVRNEYMDVVWEERIVESYVG